MWLKIFTKTFPAFSFMALLLGATLAYADNSHSEKEWESAFESAFNAEHFGDALKLLPNTDDYTAMRFYLLVKLNRGAEAIVEARRVLLKPDTDKREAMAILERLAYNADPASAKELTRDYMATLSSPDSDVLAYNAFVDYKNGNTNALNYLAEKFRSEKIDNHKLASFIYQELVMHKNANGLYSEALSNLDLVYKADGSARSNVTYMIQNAVLLQASGRDAEALKKVNEIETQSSSGGIELRDSQKAYLSEIKSLIYTKLGDVIKIKEQLTVERQLALNGNDAAIDFYKQQTNALAKIEHKSKIPTRLVEDALKTKPKPNPQIVAIALVGVSLLFGSILWWSSKRSR